MKRISLHKVMAKLAEEQKVELGLLDDMQNQSKDANAAYRKAMDKVDQLMKEGIRELNVAGKALVRVRPMGHRIEEQVKDLGVAMPKEVANIQKLVDERIREVDAMIKQLQRLA